MVLGCQTCPIVFSREPSKVTASIMVISVFACEYCGKQVGCRPICSDCLRELGLNIDISEIKQKIALFGQRSPMSNFYLQPQEGSRHNGTPFGGEMNCGQDL